MESLIGLVNRIQRACTALGDYGGDEQAFSSLWDALPSVAVVGGQVRFSAIFFFFAKNLLCSLVTIHVEEESLSLFVFIFWETSFGRRLRGECYL